MSMKTLALGLAYQRAREEAMNAATGSFSKNSLPSFSTFQVKGVSKGDPIILDVSRNMGRDANDVALDVHGTITVDPKAGVATMSLARGAYDDLAYQVSDPIQGPLSKGQAGALIKAIEKSTLPTKEAIRAINALRDLAC